MGSLMKRGGVYFGKLRDVDGKNVRYSTGQRTPAKAGAILAEWEKRVAAGLPARPDDAEKRVATETRKRRDATRGMTVHGLCEEFFKSYSRPKIKSMAVYWGTYGAYIRRGIQDAPLAEIPATALSRADVEQWRDGFLRPRYAPRTVNMIVRTLSVIYRWASMDAQILPPMHDPCRGVELVPVPEDRSNLTLTLAEVQKLLRKEAPPKLRTMIILALHQGLRHGEWAAATWADVDLDGAPPTLTIRHSRRTGKTKTTPKSGRGRVAPLHPASVAALTAWRKLCPTPEPEGLIFPMVKLHGHKGGASVAGWRMDHDNEDHGLAQLLRDAGCSVPTEAARRGRKGNQRVWHALKHVFLTRCRDCGMAPDVISDLGAHSMGRIGAAITVNYLHQTPAQLQRMAAELARLDYGVALLPAIQTPADPPQAPVLQGEGEGADIIDLGAVRARRAARAS